MRRLWQSLSPLSHFDLLQRGLFTWDEGRWRNKNELNVSRDQWTEFDLFFEYWSGLSVQTVPVPGTELSVSVTLQLKTFLSYNSFLPD